MGLQYNKKIFAVLVACVLLIVSSFFITGILLNSDISKTYISEYISRKTSSTINIHDFAVNLLPVPGIKLSQTRYDGKFGSVLFDSISLVLKGSELLRGRIVLDEVVIRHPKLILADSLDQEANTQPFVFLPEMKDPLFNTIFSYFSDSQDLIHIRVFNLAAPFIDSLDADLTFFKKTRQLKVNFNVFDVSIPFEELPGSVKTAVHFKNFHAEEISGIIETEYKDTVSIGTEFKNITILDKQSKPLFKTENIHAAILANAQTIIADVKPFKTDYPLMNVGAKLHLSMDGTGSNFKIYGADIDITRVRVEALKLLSDNETTQQLFEIIRSGHCPEIDIEFKSQLPQALFDENNMHLNGRIENGAVKIPETHLTASGVNGVARVEKGILFISADKGKVAGSHILSGDLAIDLINYKDVPFHGQFLLDVNLSLLPKTLIKLLPDTFLAQEMAMVDHVEGRTMATLYLSMETEKDLNVGVISEALSLTGQYERIPGEIKIDNVRFELKPGYIHLRNLTGNIDAGSVNNMNTDIRLDDPVYLDITSGSAIAYISPILAWFGRYKITRDMVSPFVDGSGLLSIDNIILSGPVENPDQWRYQVTGSASDAGLSDHVDVEQIKNMSLLFDLTHENKILQNISFDSTDFHWLDTLTSEKMVYQVRIPATIQNGMIKAMNDSAMIQVDILTDKDATAKVLLSGPSMDDLSIKKLVLKDGELTDVDIEFSDQPENFEITGFSGRFNTNSYKKYLKPAGSWANMVEKMTAGQEMTIKKISGNQIDIKTKTLSLDSLLSNVDWGSKSSKAKRENPINIDFEADHVTFGKFDLTQVQSLIRLEKDAVIVQIKEADLCGVNTTGDIRIKNGLIQGKLPFSSGTREDMQPLLVCMIGPDKFMDGKYSLKGLLSSNSTYKDIKSHLNGTSTFRAENGRIYKLSLLSRILSVINVSNVFKGKIPDITQTGFAYKSIVIDAHIENSVIHLDKAVIDGTDMTMIFSGTIDLVKDELNLNCLVAPFKTIDLIIKKIPIVNTMLDGRLISVPVKANGKISDPVVIPLHPSSVGKGLINMMSDLLKTPVKLIDKMKTEETEKPDGKTGDKTEDKGLENG